MYTLLMLVGAIPYLFLFHIGFVSFFVFLIANLVKKRYRVRFSKLKIIACLYGVAGGLLLPFMEAYYAFPNHDAPRGPIFFNLPALLSSMLIPIKGIKPYEHHWQTYLLYASFGLVGGWGLGQLIDHFRDRAWRINA